ncbi:metallophosphoesterase family protein [Lentzea sp. NBC_00516]|uniref:purple acid phosphatase family protein n=1 Tax=Lentzea sp. NBC_00516 TaxID=2903582 RepID=UPI002E820E05|nr:metallophosphoesterase family protein [Lentzea sp. NBC_00516]WUD22159.1 metallophosphoesterase family protein [Lentzea sp. NBC_00516]
MTEEHSRRLLFKVGGAALVTAAITGTGTAQAAPDGRKVRPVGRHLAYGADPSKQVVISWQQLEKVNGSYVRIATNGGEFGPKIAAELRTLKSEIGWQEGDHSFPPHGPDPLYQYYLHAKLNDLAPATTYFYVVGHDNYDPATSKRPNEIASFTTAPTATDTTPFTFTAFGDQGYGYNARKLTSLAADQGPAFHLALGNLSYAIHGGTTNVEGGHTDTDKYDAARWNSLFAQNEFMAQTTPWMLTLGNREMEEWYSPNGYGGIKQRVTMPDNAWSGSIGIYAWRYQNVGLISLDGNDICNRNTANLDHTKGKQLTWLDGQLDKFRKDKSIDFIVVYLHHAPYSTADGGGAESVAQQKWAPVFDKHKVDLVLNAHNRVYERTDPIKAGKASKDGTTYITAGAGGQALDKFYKNAPESYLGNENTSGTPTMRCFKKNSSSSTDTKVTWSRTRYRGYSIVAVDVTKTTMKVRALNEDGVLIDELTLQRR